MSKRKRSVTTSSEDEQLVRDRVEEYQRLQSINKRVMQYILRINVLDDYAKDRAAQRLAEQKAHDDHQRELRRHYVKRITELEGNHGDGHGKLADIREETEKEAENAEVLKKQHDALILKLEDTKDRNKALALKVTASEASECAAAQKLIADEYELDIIRIGNKYLQTQINDAKAVRRRYTDNAWDSKSNSSTLSADYDKLQKESEAELKSMRDEVEELLRRSSAKEDQLRSEFGTRLKAEVKKCQRDAHEEKDRGLKEMKAEHDRKWIVFNDRLQEKNDATDDLRQKIVNARLDLKANNNRHRGDTELAVAEERRADGLRVELEDIENSIRVASNKDFAKIGELEELLDTKDLEYQQLLKIKDDLAMEIRAYRLLLENEEDRLGESMLPGTTPPTPAKRADSIPATVRAKKRVKRSAQRTPAAGGRRTRSAQGN